jgi:hypothetical protein
LEFIVDYLEPVNSVVVEEVKVLLQRLIINIIIITDESIICNSELAIYEAELMKVNNASLYVYEELHLSNYYITSF